MDELEKLKKELLSYVKIVSETKKSNAYFSSKEEIQNYNTIVSKMQSDDNLKSLINLLSVAPNLETMEKMINEYIKNEKMDRIKDIDKLISNIYGIRIDSIEHRYLQNGKEVFAFFDPKLNRKRVLENVKDGSLVEQLKEMQNEQEKQISNFYRTNSEEMLKDQAYENKSELQMIFIGDIHEYKKIINGLNPEKLNSFNSLLARAETLNLKYINIEEQIALDKDGNMYESYYNQKERKSIVETPQSYRYNEEEMSTKETTEKKVDEIINDPNARLDPTGKEESDTEEEQEKIKEEYFNDYEDMADLITAEYRTYYSNAEVDAKAIFSNIMKYYENPALMDELAGNEREFYEKMVDLYAEKKEQKQKLEQNKVRKLELKNSDNNSGFGYVLLFAIIVIVVFVGILFFIMN